MGQTSGIRDFFKKVCFFLDHSERRDFLHDVQHSGIRHCKIVAIFAAFPGELLKIDRILFYLIEQASDMSKNTLFFSHCLCTLPE